MTVVDRRPKGVFSDCGRYRYFLAWPTLVDDDRAALGIFANPSTADTDQVDPTFARWIDYCRRWGYGWAWVCNVRAWRETHPRKVPRDDSVSIGPENWAQITARAREAAIVVCGWGKLGGSAATYALGAIQQAGKTPYALKLNADGSPTHPLFLRASLKPFPMEAP